MKPLHLGSILIAMCTSVLLSEPVKSGVWHWTDLPVETTITGSKRPLFQGEGADVVLVSVHATTLNPGEAPHGAHTHADKEELIVVKEGHVRVTIAGESKVLGPGSVALALAGDEHGLANAGAGPATYYILQLQSRAGFSAPAEPAKRFAKSLLLDQEAVPRVVNPRGGWRGFFDGGTGTLRLCELHETTLIGGVQNHPVHTHAAEEMVIMLEGHVNLQINGQDYVGWPGDVYFIAAHEPHTLFTLGSGQSRYFAFQWQ